MATLRDKHKLFIVQRLAEYRTPSEVVDLVVENPRLEIEAGEIDRTQVAYYDPTSKTGGQPAQKWQDLFYKVRTAVQENTQDLAIKHVGFRLAEYERMYRWAISIGNRVLAMKIMKQAAKDGGGKFTNKMEHSGPGGGPMQAMNANVDVSALEEAEDAEDAMRIFNQLFNS